MALFMRALVYCQLSMTAARLVEPYRLGKARTCIVGWIYACGSDVEITRTFLSHASLLNIDAS